MLLAALSFACTPPGSDDADEAETSGDEAEAQTHESDETSSETEADDPSLGEAEATEGSPCSSGADCPDGMMCTGEIGCDVSWTCQPARPCTRDLVQYCGCDGETIQGSGSCPPAPFSARGPC